MVMIKRGLKAADGDDFGADWTWALIRGELQPVEFGYVDNVAPDLDAGEWAPDGTQTKVVVSNRTPLASSEENFESLEDFCFFGKHTKVSSTLPRSLVRNATIYSWRGASKLAQRLRVLIQMLRVLLLSKLSTPSAAFRLWITSGALKPVHMASHMNHYFGFNVLENPKDDDRNWLVKPVANPLITVMMRETTLPALRLLARMLERSCMANFQALSFSFRLMTEVWSPRMVRCSKVRQARGWIKTYHLRRQAMKRFES